MKLYIADAFTDQVFGGNPAGVVILDEGQDFPDSETMRKAAAELRYSETAFIKRLPDSEAADGNAGAFQVRYFTPADEVDLCGHATIASFHCLKDAGLVEAGKTYTNKTLAGVLNIQIGDSILMDMAVPQYIGTIDSVDAMKELYTIMGLDYDENIPELQKQCAANGGDGSGLKPEMISTGLPDIMMPVATREQLAKISPDFPALAELSDRYKVVGVHAFTLDGGQFRPVGEDGVSVSGSRDSNPEVTAYCRNFAPLYDIDEEAATGTSNGALTYYLIRNGLVDCSCRCDMTGHCESGADCLFIQGEAMDRPSAIRSHSELLQDVKIQVGGSAAVLAKGEINL